MKNEKTDIGGISYGIGRVEKKIIGAFLAALLVTGVGAVYEDDVENTLTGDSVVKEYTP